MLSNAFLNGQSRGKDDQYEQDVSGDNRSAVAASLAAATSAITSTQRSFAVASRVMGSICDRIDLPRHVSEATDAKCVAKVHT